MDDGNANVKSQSSVFVRGIPYSVSHEELEAVFADIGPVRVARIIRDPYSGESKGYGFVRFAVPGDVDRAIAEWNGKEYAGRKLFLEKAVWKDKSEVGGAAKLAREGADPTTRPKPTPRPAGGGNNDDGRHELAVSLTEAPRTVLLWGLPRSVDLKKLRQKLRKATTTSALNKRLAEKDSGAPAKAGAIMVGGLRVLQAPTGGLTTVESLKHLPRMPYTPVNPAVEPGSSAKRSEPPPVLAVVCTDKKFSERLVDAVDGKTMFDSAVTARRAGAVLPRAAAKKRARVIVRNLDWYAGHADVFKAFSAVGPVAQVHFPGQKGKKGAAPGADAKKTQKEGHKGKHSGYAFVQFYSYKDAAQAVKDLNEKPIAGRPVAVDWAVNKSTLDQADAAKADAAAAGDTAADAKAASGSGSDSDSEESSSGSSSDSSSDSESDSDSDGEDVTAGTGSGDAKQTEGATESAGDSGSDSDDEEKEDADDTTSDSDASADAEHGQSGEEALPLTVFMRNVGWSTDEDALYEALRVFGPLRYVVCVRDRATGQHAGTAFAAFKFAHSAAAAVLAANAGADPAVEPAKPGAEVTAPWSATEVMASAPKGVVRKLKAAMKVVQAQGGLSVDGRQLSLVPAVDKKSSVALKKPTGDEDGAAKFEKRHLYLAKEGRIAGGSAAADDMPAGDLARRDAAARDKKVKLASPLFFVAPTKLSFRNVGRWVTDGELRKIARQGAQRGLAAGLVREKEGDPTLWLPEWRAAAGAAAPARTTVRVERAKIFREKTATVSTGGRVKLQAAKSKQARAIRTGDMDVTDVQITGSSKGFGFVEFTEHIHALAALRYLNNNPDPAVSQYAAGGKRASSMAESKRPRLIVEFAVENKAKLKIQEKRREAAEQKRLRILAEYGSTEAASKARGEKRAREAEAAAAAEAAEEERAAKRAARAAAAADSDDDVSGDDESVSSGDEVLEFGSGGAFQGQGDDSDAAADDSDAEGGDLETLLAAVRAAAPEDGAGSDDDAAPSNGKGGKKGSAGGKKGGAGGKKGGAGAGGKKGGAGAAPADKKHSARKPAQEKKQQKPASKATSSKGAADPASAGGAAAGGAPAHAAAASKGRGTKRARETGGSGKRSGEAAADARGAKFRALRAKREKSAAGGAGGARGARAGKGGAKSGRFAATDKLDSLISARRRARGM